MVAEALHKFSVEEYYRMGETGVLPCDARVELVDGQIFDMARVAPFHSGVAIFLTMSLTNCAGRRWLTTAHNPVRLNDYSEPQPDVMLLRPAADYYKSQHPGPKDVFLLIEIFDSSLEHDQKLKIPAYTRAGIAEVWIVNLNELTLEVYREPHFTGYASKTVLNPGDKASPQVFPDVVLDVAELLKR